VPQANFVFLAGKANDDMRGLVKGLQNYGNALVIAVDGKDAIKLLKKNKTPTVILLNSILEGINTLEVCQKIKQMRRFANTPVLVLEEETVDRTEYEVLGIHQFVKKPYSSTEINELVREQAASKKPGFALDLSFKQQMMCVGAMFLIFVAFMMYFILYPMYLTETGQLDKTSKKKAKKIIDSAREMEVRR